MAWWVRKGARTSSQRASTAREIRAFHESLPGYAWSPLTREPALAARCGVGDVWVKQETWRLGLPSFKVLGASWATQRVVTGYHRLPLTTSLRELCTSAAGTPRLVAATEGNHGRAVAWMARQLGLPATIFVPDGVAGARLRAIASEGAEVVEVAGDYDAALVAAAARADGRTLVVSDAAWDGYEAVPWWVVDGYSTIFAEVDDQLPRDAKLDCVVVQVGVGTLAAAVSRWVARRPDRPRLLTVEPHDAACLLRSLEAGAPTATSGPFTTSMVGLRCANVSPLTWPVLHGTVDAAVSVGDVAAAAALTALAQVGVATAPTGAAALAGLLQVAEDIELGEVRRALGITATSSVLVIVSEGATDRL